jgi:hypothetical protein
MARTRTIRATVIIGVTAAIGVALTAAAAPGNASPIRPAVASSGRTAGDQASDNDSTAGELAANAVAQRLQSAVTAARLSGFSGVEVNPSQTRPGVTVYWHGQVPSLLPRLADVAGSARASGIAAGVAVQFLPAPFTQAQLQGLQNVISDSPDFFKSGISSLGFFPQATGLWINVDTQADLAKARALVGRTRIPVHYAVSPGAMLSTVPGRYKDTPPFAGGVFIASKIASSGYQCSTGFGMHYRNRKGSPWFILTAFHCFVEAQLGTQRFWVWGNKKDVGATWSVAPDNDAGTLQTAQPYGVKGAGGSDEIYLGGTSITNSVKGQSLHKVVGAISVKVGDLVSTSGAFSGQRAAIKVKSVNWEWAGSTVDGTGYRVFGALAYQIHHLNAAGHGDSGGPVFILNKGNVEAVGIISATSNTSHKAVCTGVLPSRGCYWDIEFPFMIGTSTSIEDTLNMTVNT